MRDKTQLLKFLQKLVSQYHYRRYREKALAYSQFIRVLRTKLGICQWCGRVQLKEKVGKHFYCKDCWPKRNKGKWAWIKKRMSAGLCSDCSRPVSKGNKRFCDLHRLLDAARKKSRRELAKI